MTHIHLLLDYNNTPLANFYYYELFWCDLVCHGVQSACVGGPGYGVHSIKYSTDGPAKNARVRPSSLVFEKHSKVYTEVQKTGMIFIPRPIGFDQWEASTQLCDNIIFITFCSAH